MPTNPMYGLYAGSEDWDTEPGWLERAILKARGGVQPPPAALGGFVEPTLEDFEVNGPVNVGGYAAAPPTAAAAPPVADMPSLLGPGLKQSRGTRQLSPMDVAFMKNLDAEIAQEQREERLMRPEQLDEMAENRVAATRQKVRNPVGMKADRFANMPPLVPESPPRKIRGDDVRRSVSNTVKGGSNVKGVNIADINQGRGIKGYWDEDGKQAAIDKQKEFMARPRPDITGKGGRNDRQNLVNQRGIARRLERDNPGIPNILALELAHQLQNMPDEDQGAPEGQQAVPVPQGQRAMPQIFQPSGMLSAYIGGPQGYSDYIAGNMRDREVAARLQEAKDKNETLLKIQDIKGIQEGEQMDEALEKVNSPEMVIAERRKSGQPPTVSELLAANMRDAALASIARDSGGDLATFNAMARQVPGVTQDELARAWATIGRDWESDNAPGMFSGIFGSSGARSSLPQIPERYGPEIDKYRYGLGATK